MEMFGRTVIPTILDPVPSRFRMCPRHVVLNPREVAEINSELAANDLSGGTFKYFVSILQAADELDARCEGKKRRTRRRRK